MKRISLILSFFAAFLCLAQSAHAQYIPAQIQRNKDMFVDENHRILSDNELIDAVGADIFEETVVGARKQYNAGRKLIRGGAITMGSGLLSMIGGSVLMYACGGTGSYIDYYNGKYADRYYSEGGNENGIIAGAVWYVGGAAALLVGSMVLEAGIPLKIIGTSRLNWVENDYNARQDYTLHVGAAPNGFGLTLNF